MNLTSVEIQNFHCYKEATFPFTKETTVLIGKNGSGKSSLIKAMRNALSIFFSNNTSWDIESLARSVSDLGVTNLKVREVWHNEKNETASNVTIRAKAFLDERTSLDWTFRKDARENAKLQSSYYKNAYLDFRKKSDERGVLPLFVYYSDRFPHIDAKLSTTIRDMLDNDDGWDRCWGYYHWDYDTSCAEIWQKRFIRTYDHWYAEKFSLEDESSDKQLAEKRIALYKSEIDFVSKYLKAFTDNQDAELSDTFESLKISELKAWRAKNGEDFITVDFADGHRRRWDELPAGYERLFNIVFDLAYRSYILNGPDHEVEGVVFIDELDLHLHPSMEQDVLRRFRNAFPKIQLIASTHSPLIISNFRQNENNSIIQMTYVNGEYDHRVVGDIFGMDYDMTLSAVMGTEPRNVYLRLLQEKYVRLVKREKVEKAQEVLEEIKKIVSEDRFRQLKNELDNSVQQTV